MDGKQKILIVDDSEMNRAILNNSSVDMLASFANRASLSEVLSKFSSFELFCICISRG